MCTVPSLHIILISFSPVLGSLSEDAPPPSRSMAVGQAVFSARHSHPMALARSLPVSVPVWGCRGNRAAQGDSNSGERVSTCHSTGGQSGWFASKCCEVSRLSLSLVLSVDVCHTA